MSGAVARRNVGGSMRYPNAAFVAQIFIATAAIDIPELPHHPRKGSFMNQPPFGCARCDARWNGYRTAHCAAERSSSGELFTLGDGDSGLGAGWDTHPLEGAVDRSGITGQLLADFVGAQALRVQHRRLSPPGDGGMFESMVIGGQWTKVRWTIVGTVPIDVVNVLSVSDAAIEHPVLVGFDVRFRRDLPAESDVAMGSPVATRLVFRDRLAGRKVSGGDPVSRASARATKTFLGSSLDHASAHSAMINGHSAILHVTAMCHRTFTTVSTFDKHRTGSHAKGTRHCVPPAEVGLVDAGRAYPCWAQAGTWEREDD